MPVPTPVRRFVYGLLAALGFALMVPQVVAWRRLETAMLDRSAGLDWIFQTDTAALGTEAALFLLGLLMASAFLYLALSTGYPRAWKPRENGEPTCRRCGAKLRFGMARCPACDQQLVW